eukprot:365035-Chlamydomonas_euryale.AAC.2
MAHGLYSHSAKCGFHGTRVILAQRQVRLSWHTGCTRTAPSAAFMAHGSYSNSAKCGFHGTRVVLEQRQVRLSWHADERH